MICQIRYVNGELKHPVELSVAEIVARLKSLDVFKVSFPLNHSARLALYPDGTFQIFGGPGTTFPLLVTEPTHDKEGTGGPSPGDQESSPSS